MAQWSDNAKIILEKRYLLKDKKGNLTETPDELLVRVARHISSSEKEEDREKWFTQFMSILDTLEFLPNSPTLMNSGKPNGQLAACLSGDTIVRTLEGDFTIKDLSEKYKDKQNERFDVYSASGVNSLEIGKAFAPRKTRSNADVFKVTFDDGSFVKSTEEHLFMTRNAQYKRLDELKIGDSMMPFNYDYNHGYRVVFSSISGMPMTAHKFVYGKNTGQYKMYSNVLHHIDFNKNNNNFTNLKLMDKLEHFLYHSQNFSGDNNPMRRFPELCEMPRKERIFNHKVVSVEYFGKEDVYDLSVEKYHNFAANNVFVHNCFVLDIQDDLANIFEIVKQCALIHKSGGGCFKDGTEVITKSGVKNIKECFTKESVLCYNTNENKFEWGFVTEVFKTDVIKKKKVEIEFENGEKIICTEDHPFLVNFNGIEKWVNASKLTSEMDIVNYESFKQSK